MHGTNGEDGALMGMLEMAGVAYAGCGLSASVIAMDKVLAKQVAQANNIPVTQYQHVTGDDFQAEPDKIVAGIDKLLKYPLFVKPASLGSSIGITRAADKKELQNGIEVAAHYDVKILVEEAVQNLIEVTLPITGNNQPQPALLERPLTQPEDYFDFETKYMQNGKKGGGKKSTQKGSQGYSELPAKLPAGLYKKAEKLGLDTYRALGCSGIARVDMLIDSKTEEIYFNEVNPLPGGLYAHNFRASGMSSVELVERLVDLALERHESKQKVTTAFSTNYLQQF
jgi:D-alanine-D-alanine ligase